MLFGDIVGELGPQYGRKVRVYELVRHMKPFPIIGSVVHINQQERLSSERSSEARGLCTATRRTAGRATARRRDGHPRVMACVGGLGGADQCPGSGSPSLLPLKLRRAWSLLALALLALALLATPLLARKPPPDSPLTTGMSQPPRRRSRQRRDLVGVRGKGRGLGVGDGVRVWGGKGYGLRLRVRLRDNEWG